MVKRALIVLNGTPCSNALAGELEKYVSHTVCADGGFNWYHRFDFPIDAVIGDIDSGNLKFPEGVEIINIADQDTTDYEKVLDHLIDKGFRKFFVIGGTGKESDHFLSNLVITSRYSAQADIVLFSDRQWIKFVDRSEAIFHTRAKDNPVISIFGWPSVSFVNSVGLKYPLDGINFNAHFSGSRNIAIDDTLVIFSSSGSYFIFINEDPLLRFVSNFSDNF